MPDFQPPPSFPKSPPRAHVRRLSDKIFLAFDHACDTAELDVAHNLLIILEEMFVRPSSHPKQDRRKNIESVVVAHQRLWALRKIQSQNGIPPFWQGDPAGLSPALPS